VARCLSGTASILALTSSAQPSNKQQQLDERRDWYSDGQDRRCRIGNVALECHRYRRATVWPRLFLYSIQVNLRAPLPPKEFGPLRGRSMEPNRGTALLWSRGVPNSCGPLAPARGELREADPPLGQERPQPPADKRDLTLDQPTHEDIVAPADRSRHRKDLMTFRMRPPATSKRLSSYDLSK
jgi:hypothetical protein